MTDPKNSEAQLKQLYKKWPDIRKFLSVMGCKARDAEDIFQEALIIFVRKQEDPAFELTVEPFFYVRNTCKLLWYNLSRKQQKVHETDDYNDVAYLEDEWFEKEMKLRHLERAITRIGVQCQELLQLFYGLGWSMVDIARKLDLRNDKVAKVQKYRCINKVKDQVALLETEEVSEPKLNENESEYNKAD